MGLRSVKAITSSYIRRITVVKRYHNEANSFYALHTATLPRIAAATAVPQINAKRDLVVIRLPGRPRTPELHR